MTSIVLYPNIPCAYPVQAGANVTTAVGNTPSGATPTAVDGSSLGLELPTGFEFALEASTLAAGATVNLAWAINWVEKD